MTATPARCGPWHDALRFRYESGSTIADLAYWYAVPFYKMRHWLILAGAEIKRGKRRVVC